LKKEKTMNKLTEPIYLAILLSLVLALAILLPLGMSAVSAAPPAAEVLAQEEITYTVKLGDNLWTLAEKYLDSGPAYRAIVDATNAKHDEDPSFAHIENPDLIHPGWKLLIPGAGEAVTSEEDITAQLQATLDGWREDNDIIGVTLAVHAPESGSVELASGLSDRDAGTPMTPGHRLGVGSVTKTWVATLVLQLVDEGALTLDDPLSRWFPDFPNADKITVRQLLSHTSGATNYYAQLEKLAGILFERIPTDLPGLTPDELIAEATQLEPSFEPGEDLLYSNTNYVLLGRIVELVTGNPLHAELRSRIYEPLGLEDTFLGGDEEIPGGWGPGYTTEFASMFSATEPTVALYEPVAAKLATLPWASGALVTTAPDLLRFERALFGGELLEEETLTEMLTPVVVSENHAGSGIDLRGGLGVFGIAFPRPLGSAIGHDGGIPGFRAAMLFFPDHKVSVVMLVNDDRAETGIIPPPERDIDTLVKDVLVQVLEHTTGEEIKLEVEQPAPVASVYQDPQGRFSMPLIGDWTPVETDGTYAQFAYADMPLFMNIVTVESDDLEASVDAALRQIGVDPAALTETLRGTWDKWSLVRYSLGDGQGVTVLAQAKDGTTYAIVATGDEALTANPPDDVMKTIQGFTLAGEEVLPTTVEEFEAYVNSFVGDKPPGLSVVIALGGDVIYAQGFGMADGPRGMAATADTVYHWASITKIVTAVAIMQLREQGLVDLDAPASDYLDYFPIEYPITVRHLLSHSSGLPEPTDFVWVNLRLDGQPLPDFDLVDRTFYEWVTGLMFEPGEENAYVNPDYLTLGQIVAKVSGQPYIEYVQEHILAPLGMENTDFTYSNEARIANAAAGAVPAAEAEGMISLLDELRGLGDGADFFRETDDRDAWMNRYLVGESAGGGLIGPPTELVRFAQMLLNGGELDGVRILSRESVALMQEAQLSTSGEPLAFGLGWYVVEEGEHPYLYHDGGGGGDITNTVRMYLKEGFAVVLMRTTARGLTAMRS